MLGYETDDIIINFFESFLNNYQKEEQIMRGASDFVFESVELLDYKLHKIKLQRGGSYIKSPKWIRDKSVTINPKNKRDSNCFQYAVSIALDHQDIGNDPQIISKINPLLINITGEVEISQRAQKTGKSVNKIIRQLLLIYYMYHTIKKK